MESAREAEVRMPDLFRSLLNDGEVYAGILIGKDGAPHQHVILLPGQKDDINWDDAMAWAAELGGELPTRREQALLFANLPEEFESAWYWSSAQHAANAYYAWGQSFNYGNQDRNDKGAQLRARAVRRLPI